MDLIAAAVVRMIRFAVHSSYWWVAGWLTVLAYAVWQQPDWRTRALVLFGALCVFAAPYVFRHFLLRQPRRFHLLRVVLAAIAIGAIIPVGIAIRFGYGSIALGAYVLFYSLYVGIQFWCLSDEMFEMMSWLAFPTELGEFPDEIELIDRRRINWPGIDQPVRAFLFRFRDGDRWLHGISGPITFSFFEDLDGKTPEEIYAAYADWYAREEIEELIDEELQGGDDD